MCRPLPLADLPLQAFVNLLNATHSSVALSMAPYIEQYFLCHLSSVATACQMIYGRSPTSMCTNPNYDYVHAAAASGCIALGTLCPTPTWALCLSFPPHCPHAL